MSGFYLMTRGITSHPLFKGKPERLAVWIWLLDNVAWRDTTHDVGGNIISVERGSVCASERGIAEACGVGRQVVRTALKRFQDEHMINQNITHGKSVISLCNYEKHQRPEKENNPPLTQHQPSTNPQKKQGNKGTREDTNVSSRQKRGSRLPDDWQLPKAWGKWAMDLGLPETTVRDQADRFRDYWHSVSGAKGVKADWQATWRNWARKALDDIGRPGASGKRPPQAGDRKKNSDGQIQEYEPGMGWVDFYQ